MKINLSDNENFDKDNKFSLKKIAKTGAIFATTLVIGGTLLSNINKKDEYYEHHDYSLIDPSASASISVDGDSLNNMNIIINDNDCSDTFFNDVCDNLRDDGLKFETASNNIGIDKDNAVVITLDQQYSSGPSTLIFAPFNNSRIGDSDSLAISMQAAFKQNGFSADEILCGKVGYREDTDGNVSGLIPTETEEGIDENNDTSFVTISFGTENANAEWVAKSIENGLARQKYYIDNFDSNTDLIYRASNNENVQVVADYFGFTANELTKFNNLKDSDTLEAQTIINPAVEGISVFNKDIQFNIDDMKTRAY